MKIVGGEKFKARRQPGDIIYLYRPGGRCFRQSRRNDEDAAGLVDRICRHPRAN